MKATLYQYNAPNFTSNSATDELNVQLVLCFASKDLIAASDTYPLLKNKFPHAEIVLCSTAGEICHNIVEENTMVVVALEFEKTTIQTASVNIKDFTDSYETGLALVNKLPTEELSYLLVLSDGNLVNGSNLVRGLNDAKKKELLVTGGLAGDGNNFKTTLVGLNKPAEEGMIVGIGFYGKNLLVTNGSEGGWDTFGLEKEVTKSTNNKVFEIDGKNALDIYKQYLGPDAQNLPGSALLFPLSIMIPGIAEPIVRTILSIDETEKSMTFAGDIPTGSKVRFMRGNFDKIILASGSAAEQALTEKNLKPDFALLVSCVGRKLILGQRIEEEIEAVNAVFGDTSVIAGFYSYGEIAPSKEKGNSQLHNQTMTITSFYEL